MTCDKCRKGMLENRAAIDEEETTADQWRSRGLRWYGFVGCVFLIYVVYRIVNLLAGLG